MSWFGGVQFNVKSKMPPFRSAGNGTSTLVGYRFIDSSVITHSTQFIHQHVLLIQICCSSWGKNMFWLFGIVKNTLRKIVTRTLCSLFPVGFLLPWLVTMKRRAEKNGLHKEASFWDCLSFKRKQHYGTMAKNPVFVYFFPDLQILCLIITFIL